jgi:hypothetical protein
VLAAAALLLWSAATAGAAQRCGRVLIPSHGADAKVRVVHGRVSCESARHLVAAAFKAEATRHWNGYDQLSGIYWSVEGWRCYIALADSQTLCHKEGREVDGSLRHDDGWSF